MRRRQQGLSSWEKPRGPTAEMEEPEGTTLTRENLNGAQETPQSKKAQNGKFNQNRLPRYKTKPASKIWQCIKRRLKLNKKTFQINSALCHPDNAKTESRTLEFRYDRRESSGNAGEAVRMGK